MITKKIMPQSLVLAILLSAGLGNSQINATNVGNILTFAGLTAAGTALTGVGLYLHNNYIYKQAKHQHKMLDSFTKNTNYTKLDENARNLYFKKWFSSRLQKEYPVPALERDATSNSWTLWFYSFNPFSKKSGPLSEKLETELPTLRKHPKFIDESRAYQKEAATEEYRNRELNIKENKLDIDRRRDARESEYYKDYHKEKKDRERGIRPRDGRY